MTREEQIIERLKTLRGSAVLITQFNELLDRGPEPHQRELLYIVYERFLDSMEAARDSISRIDFEVK